MDKHSFQYCQKIVVFSSDVSKVLLCKRQGEADHDGEFSFIGGKMETSDASIVEGLKREKDEEVGEGFKIKLYPTFSTNRYVVKKDGSSMVLPHYYAVYVSGDIELNEEYSEFKWVPLTELNDFEPKIAKIPAVVEKLLALKGIHKEEAAVIL